MVQDSFLDAYDFWEDEKTNNFEYTDRRDRGYKRMLGYPKDADGEYLLIVEIRGIVELSRRFSGKNKNTETAKGIYHATGRIIFYSNI